MHKSLNAIQYVFNFLGRQRTAVFVFVILLSSALDLLGIAIIFPYLKLVLDPSKISEKIGGVKLLAGFFDSPKKILLWISSGLIVTYLLKSYIQILLSRHQFKVAAEFTRKITDDTVALVLRAKYAVFQRTAASEIVGVASSNTVHATLLFQAVIQLVTEGFFLFILFFGIFFVDRTLGLMALVLTIFLGILLYFLVVKRTALLGAAQSGVNGKRHRLQYSMISAIRDIKVMGLAEIFSKKNEDISEKFSDIAWRYGLSNALPRFFIEATLLIGLVVAMAGLIFSDVKLENMVPLFGIVAITAMRVIPSFSRIIAGFNGFRYSLDTVQQLIEMRTLLSSNAHQRVEDGLSFEDKIELRNIHFSYDGHRVLDSVGLEIRRGTSIGIVGPSGSGKTTLLDLLTGLQQAQEGDFYADGRRFSPFDSLSLERMTGYVPQSITLLDESIAFNITFEDSYDHARLDDALVSANLQGLIAQLPMGVDTFVGENGLRLSGGQRQRVGIARALYRQPSLLIFDEATSALDTISEKEIAEAIDALRGKVSTVIVAHRLSTVVNCDVIYVLEQGRIVDFGTHSELLERCGLYQEMHMMQ